MKLSTELNFLIIIPLIISVSAFGFLSYNILQKRILDDKLRNSEALISLASDELSERLYDLDMNRTKDFLLNMKKNPAILKINIISLDKKIILDGTKENSLLNETINNTLVSGVLDGNSKYYSIKNNEISMTKMLKSENKVSGILLMDFSVKEINAYILELLFFLAMLSLAIISITVIMGFSIAQSISRPIYKLKQAAFEISKGNLENPIKVSSNNELEDLGKELDFMRLEIKEYRNQLELEFNKVSEERLKTLKAYEKLKQIDKLKDDFLSNVSHELRTPLTNIKTYNQIIYDELQGSVNKKQKGSLKISLDCIDRLGIIINNLLELSKYEANMATFHLRKEDIKKPIEEVVNEFGPVLSNMNSDVNVSFDKNLPKVNMDTEKIKEVMRNLISNSIKYKRDIALKLSINVSVQKYLMIRVKDNGIGIPKNKMKNLFNRFYQVEQVMTKTVAGTGLGLSIIKHIIRGHKGRIEVKSTLGEGTEFIVYLPINKEK